MIRSSTLAETATEGSKSILCYVIDIQGFVAVSVPFLLTTAFWIIGKYHKCRNPVPEVVLLGHLRSGLKKKKKKVRRYQTMTNNRSSPQMGMIMNHMIDSSLGVMHSCSTTLHDFWIHLINDYRIRHGGIGCEAKIYESATINSSASTLC